MRVGSGPRGQDRAATTRAPLAPFPGMIRVAGRIRGTEIHGNYPTAWIIPGKRIDRSTKWRRGGLDEDLSPGRLGVPETAGRRAAAHNDSDKSGVAAGPDGGFPADFGGAFRTGLSAGAGPGATARRLAIPHRMDLAVNLRAVADVF